MMLRYLLMLYLAALPVHGWARAATRAHPSDGADGLASFFLLGGPVLLYVGYRLMRSATRKEPPAPRILRGREAKALIATEPPPMQVRHSRGYAWLTIAGGLAVAAGLAVAGFVVWVVFLHVRVEFSSMVKVWLVLMVPLVACIWLNTIGLRNQDPVITLDRQGITDTRLGEGAIPWAHIDNVYYEQYLGGPSLVLRFADRLDRDNAHVRLAEMDHGPHAVVRVAKHFLSLERARA